jgi:hypothetical protein
LLHDEASTFAAYAMPQSQAKQAPQTPSFAIMSSLEACWCRERAPGDARLIFCTELTSAQRSMVPPSLALASTHQPMPWADRVAIHPLFPFSLANPFNWHFD